jgi:hypothetical protein
MGAFSPSINLIRLVVDDGGDLLQVVREPWPATDRPANRD